MEQFKYLEYPQIPYTSVKLYWITNYYDGPISGILEHQGQRYRFDQCDEYEDIYEEDEKDEESRRQREEDRQRMERNKKRGGTGWARRYIIQELTPEQLKDEEYWHAQFEQHVGTHWNCVDNKRQDVGTNVNAVKPGEEWNKFYDEYAKRVKPDYVNNKIIGWYER